MSESAARRDEYADMTRRAVVDAARRLFDEQGYEHTTVRQIAQAARVSPATVYSQCGGKEGLLGTLIDQWTAGNIVGEIIRRCADAASARAALEELADGYVQMYSDSADIARIVHRAAASVEAAARFSELADDRHLAALDQIVGEFATAGWLRDDIAAADAARTIFFLFRHQQYDLAVNEFGWGVERTRDWFVAAAAQLILR